MSKLFDKNDFNISIKKINNGILCDLISWEINNFDNEIKIINFNNKILNLKIKNEINCEIDFNTLTFNCNNHHLEKLIKKSLDNNIIKFLNNFNLLLKNNIIDMKKNNTNINWNPYDYLDIKKKYSFDINLLKENAYKKKIYNLHSSNDHIIDNVINEIKILDDNKYNLFFIDDNIFNFDVNLKMKNSYEIKINIDLESYYYPHYPPLISFYDNFNNNLENKIINLSYLKLENWNSENTLLNILNHIVKIIDENLTKVYVSEDKFKNLNLIISKIISLNKIIICDDSNNNLNLQKINLYFDKNKENINIENLYEIKLFKKLFSELNDLSKDENLISFLKKSDLSNIIEYYIKIFNFENLNLINNYNIYNIIFSIVDMFNFEIINQEEYNILKNKICNESNEVSKSFNIMKEFLVTESLFKNYYYENYHRSSIINKNSIKKINEELIEYKNLVSDDYSIFITYNKYDCKNLMVLIIGSKNSFCENGCFIFHILCEDYPNKIPRIYFEKNDIIPIINTDFQNEIYKNWDKNNSSIIQILNIIQNKAFDKDSLLNKILKNNNKLTYEIYKYAILDKLTNPYEEFKDIIINHFKLKKNDIILNIKNDKNLNKLGLEIIEKLNKL